MTTKIFITGSNKIDKLKYAKKIEELDDDLSISQIFSNDESLKNSYYDEYRYYLDSTDIDISYKNNAFLFISCNDSSIYSGITLDSFYNEDIFCMSINEFNNIPDYIFENNDILVIWLDTKVLGKDKSNKDDIMSSKHLIEKIDKLNVLYFLDEDENIVGNTVISYLEGDYNEKQKILEENY